MVFPLFLWSTLVTIVLCAHICFHVIATYMTCYRLGYLRLIYYSSIPVVRMFFLHKHALIVVMQRAKFIYGKISLIFIDTSTVCQVWHGSAIFLCCWHTEKPRILETGSWGTSQHFFIHCTLVVCVCCNLHGNNKQGPEVWKGCCQTILAAFHTISEVLLCQSNQSHMGESSITSPPDRRASSFLYYQMSKWTY